MHTPVFMRFFKTIAVFIALLLILLLSGRMYVSYFVQEQLQDRGLSWEEKTESLLGMNIFGVTGSNIRISRIHIPFQYPPTVTLFEPSLYWNTPSTPSEESQNAIDANLSAAGEITVRAQNLSLTLPHIGEIEGLEGTLHPNLQLSNDDFSIVSTNNHLQVRGSHQIQQEHLLFPFRFEIQRTEETIQFSLYSDEWKLKHQFLAPDPIVIPTTTVQGEVQKGYIRGSLGFQNSVVQFSGTLDKTTFQSDLELEFTVALQDLLQIFSISDDVQGVGALRGTATIQYPSLNWSVTPEPSEFDIKGSLIDRNALQYGTFLYKSPSAAQYRRAGSQTADWVPFERLGHLPVAAVAAEDASFWTHKGYSFDSIQEALESHRSHAKLRGGSTITQQLAKNLYLSPDKNLKRKLRELIYAIALERELSKEEIITLYLNIVEFGPNIHGVKQAARTYFLKPPHALSLIEAAYLAAVLPSPQYYFKIVQSRSKIPTYRVHRILLNMKDGKKISTQEYNAAIQDPLIVLPPLK